jgi:hypothetical protein
MKKIKIKSLLILCSIFLLSCGSSDDDAATVTPPTGGSGSEIPNTPITDTNLLIATTNLGEVFQIGNNTGDITNIGQITRENNASILTMQSFVATDDKIYAIEYLYNPSPTNNLLIYDRQTNTTQIQPLTLPATIMGDERGFISLVLDGTSLIGILAENVLVTGQPKHIVRIDLQDYSITELGITFTEDAISDMEKIDSKLYVSTWGSGFLEIDLNTNTVTNNTTINGSRLARVSDTELAIMEVFPNSINGARPGIINLTNQTLTPNAENDTFGLVFVFGSTLYANQTYLNLVVTNDIYFGILKTNFDTGENTLVEVNSTDVDRNMIIVDVVPTN